MLLIPLDQANIVVIGKYLSAIGLTCLFWDHFLTFDDEVVFWGKDSGVGRLSKLAFFINRYLSEIIMLYTAYVISGLAQHLTIHDCTAFIWMFGLSAMVFNVISHFIILFRIYSLWDRRRKIAGLLIATFLASIAAIISLVVLAAKHLISSLTIIEEVHLCVMTRPLEAKLLLGMLTLFDFFLTVLTIYNALERPHRTHVDVIRNLQAEGMKIFLFLVGIRFMNLLVALFGPPALFIPVSSIVWALCTVINSRLHLRLEGLRLFRPPGLGGYN